MKLHLCFLLALGLLNACSPVWENRNLVLADQPNLTCGEYMDAFSTIWEKKDGYYTFHPNSSTFYWDFVQNTNVCFQGYSDRQLKRILGIPNQINGAEWVYFVAEACISGLPECNVQVFLIENGYFKKTLLVRHGLGPVSVH